MTEPLKALSICQPWAEQILHGEKTSEYRSKPTKVRGRIYVYASLGRYDAAEERGYENDVGFAVEHLPRGLIVGTVEIVDCTGSDGNFEWELANPVRFAEPLAPQEQPQPVWFHPLGRPDDESPAVEEEFVEGNQQDDSQMAPTNARFARAASLWCKRATEHAGGKPWKYLLIPHDVIDESKTLAGLGAAWEFQGKLRVALI
jgi:hypothetical protein